MYLVINKCVAAVKDSNFSGHYLRKRSTMDIGVLAYIGIVQHKEHIPEVWHFPPGTPCIDVRKELCTSYNNLTCFVVTKSELAPSGANRKLVVISGFQAEVAE